MNILLDPRIFNYMILILFALATVRWTIAGQYWEALYWFGALILNIAVTYGFPK